MDEFNLTELRNKCLNSLYGCIENISKYLDKDTERDEEFKKLRGCVEEYCKMEKLEQAGKKAIESLEEESDYADWATVQAQYENKLAHYNRKSINFNNHSFMKELKTHINAAEASREQNADQELAVTETRETYIDPISKTLINNPVRNKICSHFYDKKSIDSYIKNRKNKGCPYVGCPNEQIMLADHLEQDEGLLCTIRRTQQSVEMDVDE